MKQRVVAGHYIVCFLLSAIIGAGVARAVGSSNPLPFAIIAFFVLGALLKILSGGATEPDKREGTQPGNEGGASQATESMAHAPGNNAIQTPIQALLGTFSFRVPLLFGQYRHYQTFSDGRFLELSDELPAQLQALRTRPKAQPLVEKDVEACIPDNYLHSSRATDIRDRPDGRTVLSDGRVAVAVDTVVFRYLKYRYPNALILINDPLEPVVFVNKDELRAVLMPIKE